MKLIIQMSSQKIICCRDTVYYLKMKTFIHHTAMVKHIKKKTNSTKLILLLMTTDNHSL